MVSAEQCCVRGNVSVRSSKDSTDSIFMLSSLPGSYSCDSSAPPDLRHLVAQQRSFIAFRPGIPKRMWGHSGALRC